MGDARLQFVESVQADSPPDAETERLLRDNVYRVDFQQTAIRKKTCGNENLVIHPNDKCEGGNIFEGKLAKVDLAGLTVGDGDVIVGHAGVLAAKPAYANSLHTAGAAIVANHHA